MDSIVEKVFYWGAQRPEATAVADPSKSLSYAQLCKAVRNCAKMIRNSGVQTGDCVIIQALNQVDFVTALLAVHYAGAVAVPVDAKMPKDSVDSIREETGAKLALADRGELFSCKTVPFQELYNTCTAAEEPAFPARDQLSDLFFTTGTTGKPKGVLFNHGNLVAVVENLISGSGMEDGTVYLVYGPLNHVFSVRKIYYTLFCGNTVVLLNGMMNLKLFFRMLDEWKVTATHLLPAAAKVLFKLTKNKIGEYADRLVLIESGTSPFSEEDMLTLRQLLPNTRLFFGYGCSESDCITKLEYSKYPEKVGSVGRLTVHASVKLVNEAREEVQATRENPGLVASKGPMNMVGYWNAPELTAEVMADGYVYTNDLAYFDEDGFLYILGRVGDVINVGGIKVSAREIEELAMKFDGIEDCAVIPVADPISTQVPKLFVTLGKNAVLDEGKLREFLARSMETYMLPRYIAVIDEIPRTYNGKIQKNKLKEL